MRTLSIMIETSTDAGFDVQVTKTKLPDHVVEHIGYIIDTVSNGKLKDPQIMTLIRALYYYTSIHGMRYKAIHLSSQDNSSADALTRQDMHRFFQLNPKANIYMSQPVSIVTDFS